MSAIAIADSHTLCREALCNYIKHIDPDCRIEGFGDYDSLRNHVLNHGPDLILIDCDLLGFDQKSFSQDISDLPRKPKIGVIVSSFSSSVDIETSYQGVFSKNLSCKAFMSGIEEILSGRNFLPPFDSSVPQRRDAKNTMQDFGLTAREKEVLSHLVKGASNKDIARALDLQVVTVKLHVRGICRKMKAGNRTKAALIAQENGWGL